MPVIGFVGLPGSGKTLELVKRGLEARKAGRDVYANFRLGSRMDGYLVPTCAWGDHRGIYHAGHEATGYRFAARTAILDLAAKLWGWRSGRAFVPDAGAQVLREWDDLINLRVYRDDFDVPHREGCAVVSCNGCSRGITVLLDELNLWAPSRLWQELGIGVLNRWAYVRKDGLEIIWTAQHEARIDKVAREVTDFIWNCRSLGGVFRFMGRTIRLQVFHRTKWIPALMTEKNRTAAAEGAQKSGALMGEFEFSFYHQWIADAYDTYEHVAESSHLKERGAKRSGEPPKAAAALPRRVG
jgi:hypothetical protein